MLNDMRIHYEINPVTLAIIAEEIDGRYVSWIMEDGENGDCYVRRTPRKVMDLACKYFGSSLKGRQEGTKGICGITHKAPISIDPTSGMYFFPTSSPQNPNCSWISHSHVDRIIKVPDQCTQFFFKNGRSIILEVSHGSMVNQLNRTAQFRYLLDKRIKYSLKSSADLVAEPFL